MNKNKYKITAGKKWVFEIENSNLLIPRPP
jgi:hypothetical protein